MYSHVFPPHQVKGFWYNFLNPPLFCGNTATGEKFCSLKRLGRRAYEGVSRGQRDPEVTMPHSVHIF